MAKTQRPKKTSAEKPALPKKAGRPARVTIDYPQEGELITNPSYTFRVGGVPEGARAEVSVNGCDWQPCRESVGYWWYDFMGYSNGAHELKARLVKEDGTAGKPVSRAFRVELALEPAPLEASPA